MTIGTCLYIGYTIYILCTYLRNNI
jgi:hypothetical protein